MLTIAAVLCFLIGAIHSVLGERYILVRLFRRDNIPHLFGSDFFTKRTLRFAWHITTIACWGFAYLLWMIGQNPDNLAKIVLLTIAVVFFISGVFSFGFTRGRHLSWIVFWTITALVYSAAKVI
ncbi:MAG: hypothetical protein ACRBHB_03205 [Arenicella sp.]